MKFHLTFGHISLVRFRKKLLTRLTICSLCSLTICNLVVSHIVIRAELRF